MPRSVVVVGSLNADIIVRVPELPLPGQTVVGGTLLQAPGGKGANQAVAAARLGATVAMVGRVGRDSFASLLLDSLVQAGVGIERVSVASDAATGVALIMVGGSSGENLIAVASGANAAVGPDDVEAAASAIAVADVLLLQLEIPLAAVERALRLARSSGTLSILNAAPAGSAQPLGADLLGLADIVVANALELAALLRGPIPPGEEGTAAERLRSGNKQQVVIATLGPKGAVAAAPDGVHVSPGFVVEAIDTVGAGDAFVGGLAVAYDGFASLPAALRFANAAGALATTRPGAQPSLPGLDDVQRLLAEPQAVRA